MLAFIFIQIRVNYFFAPFNRIFEFRINIFRLLYGLINGIYPVYGLRRLLDRGLGVVLGYWLVGGLYGGPEKHLRLNLVVELSLWIKLGWLTVRNLIYRLELRRILRWLAVLNISRSLVHFKFLKIC